jgi:hypothetical protein
MQHRTIQNPIPKFLTLSGVVAGLGDFPAEKRGIGVASYCNALYTEAVQRP